MPKRKSGFIDPLSLIAISFMIVTLFVGVVLTQQRQDIREKAWIPKDTYVQPNESYVAPVKPPARAPKPENENISVPPPTIEPTPETGGYLFEDIFLEEQDENKIGFSEDSIEVSGFYIADNGKYYPIAESAGGPTTNDLTGLFTSIKEQEEPEASSTIQYIYDEELELLKLGKIEDIDIPTTTQTSTEQKLTDSEVKELLSGTKELINNEAIDVITIETPLVQLTNQEATTIQPELAEAEKQNLYSGLTDLGITQYDLGQTYQFPETTYTIQNGEVIPPEITPTDAEKLLNQYNFLNSATFGTFGDYVQAFHPDEVIYNYEKLGFSSREDCIGKRNPTYTGCEGVAYTKEQITSSINLSTTITAEGAVIAAIPVIAVAGATNGIGAGVGQTFVLLGGTSTTQQTGRAIVSQIENPFSKEANLETLMAGLSWLNLGTADYLMSSFSTGVNITNAKWANGIVSLVNLGVDGPYAWDECITKENPDPLSCSIAASAVVADMFFGALDFKQGQLPGARLPDVRPVLRFDVPDAPIAKTDIDIDIPSATKPVAVDIPKVDTPSPTNKTRLAGWWDGVINGSVATEGVRVDTPPTKKPLLDRFADTLFKNNPIIIRNHETVLPARTYEMKDVFVKNKPITQDGLTVFRNDIAPPVNDIAHFSQYDRFGYSSYSPDGPLTHIEIVTKIQNPETRVVVIGTGVVSESNELTNVGNSFVHAIFNSSPDPNNLIILSINAPGFDKSALDPGRINNNTVSPEAYVSLFNNFETLFGDLPNARTTVVTHSLAGEMGIHLNRFDNVVAVNTALNPKTDLRTIGLVNLNKFGDSISTKIPITKPLIDRLTYIITNLTLSDASGWTLPEQALTHLRQYNHNPRPANIQGRELSLPDLDLPIGKNLPENIHFFLGDKDALTKPSGNISWLERYYINRKLEPSSFITKNVSIIPGGGHVTVFTNSEAAQPVVNKTLSLIYDDFTYLNPQPPLSHNTTQKIGLVGWLENNIISNDGIFLPKIQDGLSIRRFETITTNQVLQYSKPEDKTLNRLLGAYDKYALQIQQNLDLAINGGLTGKIKSFENFSKIAEENGYTIKLIDSKTKVPLISNGKKVNQTINISNSARISADGTTLYVLEHPTVKNIPSDVYGLQHDIGAIVTGGKFVSEGEEYLLPEYVKRTGGILISSTDLNSITIVDDGVRKIPDTALFDALITKQIPRNAFVNFETLDVPLNIIKQTAFEKFIDFIIFWD